LGIVRWLGICSFVSLRPSGLGVGGVLPRLDFDCLKVIRGAVGGGMPWSSRLRFDPMPAAPVSFDGPRDVRYRSDL
jgi:hypothetical protein